MPTKLYTQSILSHPLSTVARLSFFLLLALSGLQAKAAKVSTDLCPADSLQMITYSSVDDALAEFKDFAFAAEARIGNRKNNGTYEMDIHRISPFELFNSKQLQWNNGETKSFSITYDPQASGKNKFIYVLDGKTLKLNPNNPPKGPGFSDALDGLWIYARGGTNNIVARTQVSNLNLNGILVTTDIDVTHNEQIENMVLAGVTLYDGFTLTGDITFSWPGEDPRNSQMNVGFKLGKLSDCELGNGCELSATCTATQPDCESPDGGSIEVTVEGGSGEYIFHWSNNDCTQNIEGLENGTYTVTITDEVTGCTASCSATIDGPTPIEGYCRRNNISCHGAQDGAIDVVITDGDGPFSFEWSNGEQTEDLEHLGPGEYVLTVTDAHGCTASCAIELHEPDALEISCVPTQPVCGETSDGAIDVSVSGGSGNYIFHWSNDACTEDVSGLDVGTYTVTVTDDSGCSVTCTSTISGTVERTYEVESTFDNCGSWCRDYYAFTLGRDNCYIAEDDLTFVEYADGTALLSGSVSQNGNIGYLSVRFYDRTETPPTGSPKYELCANGGGEDWYYYPRIEGTFTAPNGDVIEFNRRGPSFQIGDGANLQDDAYGASGWFDYDGGVGDMNFKLSNPIQTLPLEVACLPQQPDCLDTLGGIGLQVSGGNAPYTYLWSNGETTASIDQLPSGEYAVSVTDANGCTAVCVALIEGVIQSRYEVESTFDNCGSWCRDYYAFTLGRDNCYIAEDDLEFV
ncbi:MAG: SprB repeat-containing protein, partial [Bacteroidota bacterium]